MSQAFVSVCYHDDKFILPPEFDPPPDRLTSTPGDNLCEFAGRLCYNSVDRDQPGRKTELYWANILATKHHSVIAHIVETFELAFPDPENDFTFDALAALHCRPGVWVTKIGMKGLRFAASLRAVTEWLDHGAVIDDECFPFVHHAENLIYNQVVRALRQVYPFALSTAAIPNVKHDDLTPIVFYRTAPVRPKEKWCSLYIRGVSRDLLGELVRHHWQANPSVESTRYVDKSECVFATHPELTEPMRVITTTAQKASREAYQKILSIATDDGFDKKTAKDMARPCLLGAADTRLVLSLSQFQARHILALRADSSTGKPNAEIRELAKLMREALLTIWPDL